MTTLIVTRGLPACGKTTKARAWVAEDPVGRARINRDDIRAMCHDSVFIKRSDDTKGTEVAIQAARDAAITALLKDGVSVVCDDTNLPSRVARGLRKIARQVGAEFEVWDMTDVPIDTCIERDAQRTGRAKVGEAVIRGMWTKYISGKRHPLPIADDPEPAAAVAPYVGDPTLPRAWIVDIDGTLAKMRDRSPYDWHRVGEDDVVEAVYDAVNAFANQAEVILLSGRDGCCEMETRQWLSDCVVHYDALFMRKEGDTRRDSIVKAELFDRHIRGQYNVIGVIDDRNQVVDMWRAMGLTCLQAAPGDF